MTLLVNRPYLETELSEPDSFALVTDRGNRFSASASASGNGSRLQLRLERLSAVERARRRFAGFSLAEPPRDNGDQAEREAVEAVGIANLVG